MEDILQHIDELEYNVAFAKLEERVGDHPGLIRFRKEFINRMDHSDVNFWERLKTFIQTIKFTTDGRRQQILSRRTATPPPAFRGREQELADIHQRLKQGTLMLVNGEGGIGKTTLAAKYWEDHAHHYDYLAWLFCEQDILSAIRTLATPLGLDLSQFSAEQQMLELQRAIANLGGKFLLVLDNANSEGPLAEFEDFSRDLPWSVLITSRCRKVLENEYEVKTLSPKEARKLFRTYYEESGEAFTDLLDRFLEAIGYNTLCIEIFAKNLREGKIWQYDFASFLKELEERGLFLEGNSFRIHTHYDNSVKQEAANSDEILDILYDFSALSFPQEFLLAQLALLPAEGHTGAFLNEYLEVLRVEEKPLRGWTYMKALLKRNPTTEKLYTRHQDTRQLRIQLNELMRSGWVLSDDASFRLSPVVQRIVLHRRIQLVNSASVGMVNRLRNKLANELDNERPPLHTLTADLDAALSIVEYFKDSEGSFALAWLQVRLADFYRDIGRVQAAKNHYEEAKAYFSTTHEHNTSMCISRLGQLCELEGNLDEALVLHKQSISIAKELLSFSDDDDIHRDLGVSYGQLGRVYEAKGELDQALECFEQALEIALHLSEGEGNTNQKISDLSACYTNLGVVYHGKRNLSEAEKHYEESLKIDKQLSEDNPESFGLKFDLGVSYGNLAGIYEDQGNLDKALGYRQTALRLFQELRVKNPKSEQLRRSEIFVVQRISEILADLGMWDSALKHSKDSLSLALLLQENMPFSEKAIAGLIRSYVLHGNIFLDQGDYRLAHETYAKAEEVEKQAISKFPESDDIFRLKGLVFFKFGNLNLKLKNYEKTLQFYNESLLIDKALQERNSLDSDSDVRNEAESVRWIAISYLLLTKYSEAITYFKRNIQISKDLLDNKEGKDIDLKENLFLTYSQIATAYLKMDEIDKCIEYFLKYLSVAEEICERSRAFINATSNYIEARANLAILKQEGLWKGEAPSSLPEIVAEWEALYDKSKGIYYQEKLKILTAYQSGELTYSDAIMALALE